MACEYVKACKGKEIGMEDRIGWKGRGVRGGGLNYQQNKTTYHLAWAQFTSLSSKYLSVPIAIASLIVDSFSKKKENSLISQQKNMTLTNYSHHGRNLLVGSRT
jgi:hypothetical protein